MKTEFLGYPKTDDLDIIAIKTIEIEFKYILKAIEANNSVMKLLDSLQLIKNTFSSIRWQMSKEGLKVYSISYDLKRKDLLLITDNF